MDATKTKPKKKAEKFREDNDDEEGTQTLQEDEVANDISKVISEFVKGLPSLVKKILEDMLPPMSRTDEGEIPVEPPMLKDKTKKPAKPEGTDEKLLEMMSRLSGEISALKDAELQRTSTAKSKEIAETEIKKLKSDGWNLSEDTEKKIHAQAEQGEKSLEIHIGAYRDTVPKDPPKSLEDVQVFTQDPPELAKYKIQSPEVLEKARSLSAQFDELKAGGANLTSTREEFVDINLEVA